MLVSLKNLYILPDSMVSHPRRVISGKRASNLNTIKIGYLPNTLPLNDPSQYKTGKTNGTCDYIYLHILTATVVLAYHGFYCNSDDSFALRLLRICVCAGICFRFINEQLYTSGGKDAKEYFEAEPEEFEAYHEGYQQQVRQWPINPLDVIIKALKKK